MRCRDRGDLVGWLGLTLVSVEARGRVHEEGKKAQAPRCHLHGTDVDAR